MKRKICVVTDSRAEYGIMYWLIHELNADTDIELQIVTLGAHASPEFGNTHQDIIADGFEVTRNLETTISGDSPNAICHSMSIAMTSFSHALLELKPDMIVLLGDRYEMMAVAQVAFTHCVPIAHLHGGETTEGAIDEAFRHSITKMSTLHFTSTDNHKRRVMQLGENPANVYNFGAPAIDHIYRQKLMSREELSESIGFDLSGPIAMITYHPVTLETESSEEQVDNLLDAMTQSKLRAVFTGVNADTSGRIINKKIKEFCEQNGDRFHFVTNLGQHRYHSSLKHFDLMIGNSSSGIIESGSFQLPVVNIGPRQRGRDRGPNVIDCDYGLADISKSIDRALSSEFQKSIADSQNVYAGPEPGRASILMKDVLKSFKLDSKTLMKKFFDVTE